MNKNTRPRQTIAALTARKTAGVVVVLVATATSWLAAPATSASATPTPPGAAFTPVEPCRLLDTRETIGNLPAGSDLPVQARGMCGIPTEATAVAVTATAVNTAAAGFVTVWPAGPRPAVSMLNTSAGDTRAGSTIIGLSADGRFNLHTSMAAGILVDVTGFWSPVAGPVAAGRMMSQRPIRLSDTRWNGIPAAAGSVTKVSVAAAAGASAVAVNVTVTGTTGRGFATAAPTITGTPATSTVNWTAAGQTRAGSAIIPIAADGTISVYTSSEAHLIVDLTAVFSGASPLTSTSGLLQPLTTPVRVMDTRPIGRTDGKMVTVETPWAGSAVAGTVTVVSPSAAVFVKVWPNGGSEPNTSVVNAAAGDGAVANQVFSFMSSGGVVVRPSVGGAHILLDVTAVFTGPTGPWKPMSRPTAASPTDAWPVAARTGSQCEQFVLSMLAQYFPQLAGWADRVAVVETYAVSLSAEMKSPTSLGMDGQTAAWQLQIRPDRCAAGYGRRRHVVVHELAHMLDAFGSSTMGSSAEASYTMPALGVSADPSENFADCVTAVLGVSNSPYYTSCSNSKWRADTTALLNAANPVASVGWNCAPVSFAANTPDVASCEASYSFPWPSTMYTASPIVRAFP